MKTPLIRDYMTKSVQTIGPKESLATAHALMRSHSIRHLPVLDGGRLVGIVSQRDLYLLETLQRVDMFGSVVEEAMSPNPYVVAPSTPLASVVREMLAHRWGSAIVAEGNNVRGVFTTSDALKALAEMLPIAPRRGARAGAA